MGKFLTSWCNGKILPEDYIFPPEQRPADQLFPTSRIIIPVIDLGNADGHDHQNIVQQIIKASQEFGCFQVINHGVSKVLMEDARGVFKELFKLPEEEKSRYYSVDTSKKFIMFTSTLAYNEEEYHQWKDGSTLECTPLEECIPHWPDKPVKFREIAADFTINVNKVGSKVLELISEGLGLKTGHFAKELSESSDLNINYYPACPDPRLTLGASKHCDRSTLTILMQDHVPGLQICKDGEWIGVAPNPDAFFIILGCVMQIASNGKLRYGDHRVVTNANGDRLTAALFICPTRNCVIEPANALVTSPNRAVYRPVTYEELMKSYKQSRGSKKFDLVLEPFLNRD